MEKRIYIIPLEKKALFGIDLELSRKIKRLEELSHIDGGLIISGKIPPLTNLYCQRNNISIIHQVPKPLSQMKQFYDSLKSGLYAQPRNKNLFLQILIEKEIAKNKFEINYLS